ncbi:MAG TPA: carbon-nitrogen hydrolase family protein, partial [Nordella sp.]|nr:carbon-nitrogen hydrolase family protein [Nordella sp.]
ARWVGDAAGQGAELIVFPEYAAMELVSLEGPEVGHDLQRSIDAVSKRLPEADQLHASLARQHGVSIVAASAPERQSDGLTLNVARLFGPSGAMGRYAKLMMTPWERDPWNIAAGHELTVFDIGPARVGLLICYDIEFPLLSRALAEAGADVILAPSNTETEHGYWRVRTGAMARALENQVYTVHSPTVGPAPFCTAVENNCGAAGIFAPSDQGFPPGGVLALGELNKPQWVIAKIDLDLLKKVRETGGVQTYRHWDEQPGAGILPRAKRVDLTARAAEAAE